MESPSALVRAARDTIIGVGGDAVHQLAVGIALGARFRVDRPVLARGAEAVRTALLDGLPGGVEVRQGALGLSPWNHGGVARFRQSQRL